jgi:transcriptional regulator with XRE-family HTH domain
MSEHSPDPVDAHVGERIRRRRKLLGQSQQALAADCGVTFQQIQKYERGINRISASMMARAAKSQGVLPAYYFEDLSLDIQARQLPEGMEGALTWLQSTEALPLAESMARLPTSMREAVTRVARSLEAVPA